MIVSFVHGVCAAAGVLMVIVLLATAPLVLGALVLVALLVALVVGVWR